MLNIPPLTDARSDELGARGVLGLVLSGGGRLEFGEAPNGCPNCLGDFQSPRTPYCSPLCKEESAFVRQFRSGLATGAAEDPDRQVAYGQKFWHLLGAGYPLRVSLITEKSLAKILTRNEGKCEMCGNPAVTVDHAGSG